jgi:flagellar operon protein
VIINNNFYTNIGKINGSRGTISTGKPERKVQESFEDILKSKVNENCQLKFSKHAEMRLQARNINLTDAQKEKISKAVQKAEEKGVKDSLVLIDDIAFVVNVRNRTVITAVNSNELKENVFTNIDGAVFA